MALMTRLHSDKLEYTSSDSVHNVIRYITRTRSSETKADDLVLWGDSAGYFYNKSVAEIIHEFSFIHKLYAPYTGKNTCKICHYVFKIYDDEFSQINNNCYLLAEFAVKCCSYLFSNGFQTIFAIHYPNKNNLHIHFCINAVNYQTGHKLRQYHNELHYKIEIPFYNIFKEICPNAIMGSNFTEQAFN